MYKQKLSTEQGSRSDPHPLQSRKRLNRRVINTSPLHLYQGEFPTRSCSCFILRPADVYGIFRKFRSELAATLGRTRPGVGQPHAVYAAEGQLGIMSQLSRSGRCDTRCTVIRHWGVWGLDARDRRGRQALTEERLHVRVTQRRVNSHDAASHGLWLWRCRKNYVNASDRVGSLINMET